MKTNRIAKQILQYRTKDEGTKDDRGRHERTKFIFRIKEQETRLTSHEHDDNDDDDDNVQLDAVGGMAADLIRLVP
jgi:hypothetical protein